MDNISEEYILYHSEKCDDMFTLTSSVQDLQVILKSHNFQSLEKALNFYEIKIV